MEKTVLIADDHPLIIEGLVKQIECEASFKIVSQTSNGIAAYDAFKTLKPDIAVLDIDMEGMSGIDLTLKIKKENPATKVLLVTMHTEPWITFKAKAANPDGILLKNAPTGELIKALSAILQGEKVFSTEVQNSIMEGSIMNQALLNLTTRETEILKLIARGLSSKDMSKQLFISVNTVETYRKNLFQKFEVNNMAALVKKAIELGIVQ